MFLVSCDCGETFIAEEKHVGGAIRCKCGKTVEIVAPLYHPPNLPRPLPPVARKSPAWTVVVGILGFVGFVMFAYRSGNENPPERSTIVTTPSVVPAPVTVSVQRLCSDDSVTRPRSGAELGGRHRGGLGRVKVENGTGSDAVAVLVDAQSNAPRRAIFVRSGETGAITSVPAGNYKLRFQLGSEWLKERRFCEPSDTSEFDDEFDFTEVKSEDGTKYSTYEVTLHAVLTGTARTHAVANATFELPEQ